MKKAKFDGKLNLNKEKVSKLTDDQMKNVQGGAGIGSSQNFKPCLCLTSLISCKVTLYSCYSDCPTCQSAD